MYLVFSAEYLAKKTPEVGAPNFGNFLGDAAFLLTVGSFLLTVELFYLQST